jgi:hypothetical protein
MSCDMPHDGFLRQGQYEWEALDMLAGCFKDTLEGFIALLMTEDLENDAKQCEM